MSAWEIARKDLKLLLRDLRTAFILLALPLVFITIIGLTTGQLLGWKSENQLLRIALVDNVDYEAVEQRELRLAGTPLNPIWARNIVTKLIDRIQDLNGFMIKPAADREAAIRMVEEGDANAALVIGPDFFEKLGALDVRDVIAPGEGALAEGLPGLDMHLTSDAPGSTTETVLRELSFGTTLRTIAPYVFCSFRLQTGNGTSAVQAATTNARLRQQCSQLETEAGETLQKREFLRKTPGAETSRYYEELVPGYVVLFAFFLVNIMARSFIEEQTLGTLRRLRAAPVRPASVLVGKTVPFLIVSLLQVSLLFLCGRLLFGMSWGDTPWLLIPSIVGTSLAATGLGLLVATLVRNEAQVSAYATVVVIVMAGISGCFMPRDWLPDLMRQISLVTPHAWALMAYDEALTERPPNALETLRNCGILATFAIAYFAVGAWRFRELE